MNKNKNYYTKLPKELIKKYHNPNYGKTHFIKIPFRMLICGGSGSGKTNTLIELISRMSDTFTHIIICCKSKHEPLYEFLEYKFKKGITFLEGINNIPSLEELKNIGQALVVFDDLVIEKKQGIIEEYFIRGRKVSDGLSLVYLSQSYFRTPKVIRLQCNYIILKKLSSKRDLSAVLNEISLGVDINELRDYYKYASLDPLSFLLIDTEAPDDDKFYNGFLEKI